ncbi:hypothetical protein BO70DRAFT_360337 [Aspergillus heteromorphus CBS 117.55]|uniref:C2H2-type domain-containing protein n=1 Tax=Aspergillus heteromorphus CBS 117.55 TaxID=1448321 RepID=A0A317WMH2_9EURO|nr:uncharacterized protein BO70DRAFT_360337 [Aspergillus heteromorphus CBS 117.55]PWY87696.1 hypothetical protein BO70DRAFT_360337 [Aspergillus heteromorphus CBS 117.55]
MYECETCPRIFNRSSACKQHMDAKDHWAYRYECETCDSEFYSACDAERHMEYYGHYAPKMPCETCGELFHTQVAAEQHMNDLRHWAPSWSCDTCDQMFHTERAAEQHMRHKRHSKTYCYPCERNFQNENGLRMHQNSRIHRSQNSMCPFCKKAYTTASGVIHHVETGSCANASSLNRESVYEFVHSRDTQGAFTNRLLEWNESESSHYSVTKHAFNGYDWECYLCHREFGSPKALNAHLNSPVHKQTLYHCPNKLSRCGKEFVTLAGLFNHLEAESCAYIRFEKVQQHIQSVFTSGRSIAF